jgi:hypothetical protein
MFIDKPYISLEQLKLSKPENVIRLAHMSGLTTEGKSIEQIIEEVHFQINYKL